MDLYLRHSRTASKIQRSSKNCPRIPRRRKRERNPLKKRRRRTRESDRETAGGGAETRVTVTTRAAPARDRVPVRSRGVTRLTHGLTLIAKI